MKPAVLHVLGVPHTIPSSAFAPCAFTGKVLRFPKMMRPLGWKVVEYSNGKSESCADEHVVILTEAELAALSRRTTPTEDYSADVRNQTLTTAFWNRLIPALQARVKRGDIVCHTFGPFAAVAAACPAAVHVESGIGYPNHTDALPRRIFESAAWMAWHSGSRGIVAGNNYEFVIPNYYDLQDWGPPRLLPQSEPSYVLYFGRLAVDKGREVVGEVARLMPETTFLICGQGDPEPWLKLSPANMQYRPPVFSAADKAALLGGADVVLTPSRYIEPFCGVAVEAQLCGTPVVASSFGAFRETVVHGVTGFLCHTLADFVAGVAAAAKLDRAPIAERARSLYSLEAVGPMYDRAFLTCADLMEKGWYSPTSHMVDAAASSFSAAAEE